MNDKMLADKEVVWGRAAAVAIKWLLDTGVGLDERGERDEREIKSRLADVREKFDAAWAEGLSMMEDDDDS